MKLRPLLERSYRWIGLLMEILHTKENRNDGDRGINPIPENVPEPERSRIIELYYDYARKEIEREDSVTFNRLTLTLVFQGFLFAAFSLVLIESIDKFITTQKPLWIFTLLIPTFMMSIVGIVVSFFSFRGIEASRRSLLFAKDQWIAFNRINGMTYPHRLPQITKRSNRLSYDMKNVQILGEELVSGSYFGKSRPRRSYVDEGWDFALALPTVLMFFWIVTTLLIFSFSLLFFCYVIFIYFGADIYFSLVYIFDPTSPFGCHLEPSRPLCSPIN